MRVIQTEASQRFVGAASFAGITGAPVLITEWEPDPLRGAFPGDPPPAHAPLSHLELVETADVFAIAPGAREHARQARGRPGGQPAVRGGARVPAPARRRPGDERRDVRAPRHAGEPRDAARARGRRCSSPAPARSARRGSGGSAGCPSRPTCSPRSRRRSRGGGGDLDGLRVLVTAGGTREPIDAVRFVGNRSSGRMGWALADEAARRGAGVTVVAANVALARHRGIRYVDVETAAELARPASRVRRLRRAADGRRRRRLPPGRRRARTRSRRRDGRRTRAELERTEDVLSALAARRRPGQLIVGFAAETATARSTYGRGKLDRKRLDAVVVNDVSRPASASTPPTTR